MNLNLIALAVAITIGADGLPVPQNAPKTIPAVVEQKLPPVSCVGCSDLEQKTVEHFYNNGVTDKKALAVVRGNIKQESRFNPAV